MPGFMPGIGVSEALIFTKKDVDGRVTPGHDKSLAPLKPHAAMRSRTMMAISASSPSITAYSSFEAT